MCSLTIVARSGFLTQTLQERRHRLDVGLGVFVFVELIERIGIDGCAFGRRDTFRADHGIGLLIGSTYFFHKFLVVGITGFGQRFNLRIIVFHYIVSSCITDGSLPSGKIVVDEVDHLPNFVLVIATH